jgi:hypothetical protein
MLVIDPQLEKLSLGLFNLFDGVILSLGHLFQPKLALAGIRAHSNTHSIEELAPGT